ncbi:hypothetical protein [Nocardia sp. CA-290969]|uniref:hypothetical protein n=1 Tax=Nocardia sp. CA-290969 TaxID=3239986 RepID=UPI003D8F992B
MDDYMMQLLNLKVRAIAVYNLMAKILGGLELPITLASIDGDTAPGDMVESAIRARTALRDLPMHEVASGLLTTAITDWLSAMAMIAISGEDEDNRTWALASAGLQFGRADEELRIAKGILDGKVAIEILDDDEDKE